MKHDFFLYHENVKIFEGPVDSGIWNGSLGKVTVAGGQITSYEITNPGSGFVSGQFGHWDNTLIGGSDGAAKLGSSASAALTNANLTSSPDNLVIQVTGSGITTDAYFRTTSVPDPNKIGIAKTAGDPNITSDQYVFVVGNALDVRYSVSNGTVTFTTQGTNVPHGLKKGNRFQINDDSNNNLETLIVEDVVTIKKFTAKTTKLSGTNQNGYVLKHGLSANDSSTGKNGENLDVRGVPLYGFENARLGSAINADTTTLTIDLLDSQTGVDARFPYGSYIQIDDEIMRIASNTSTGGSVTVLRAVFGTNSSSHLNNSAILALKPIPFELHRPSILRASGHTFEYLGYGPGNYSTGLPQVQTRTLTEREEFLSQAQERSAGVVVYTGMNNRGDFYIGNTKKSSTTGEETSFDTPIPTVTGEDPARLSAIFDEITVKERIIVEGGDSRQILSQFDGPVTFNNEVRIKEKLSLSKQLVIKDTTAATTSSSGALTVEGGVGIGGDVHIGEQLFFPDDKKLNFGDGNDLQISHRADFSSQLDNAGNTITSNSASIIEDAGTGPLVFKTNSGSGNGAFQFFDQDWNPMLKIHSNGRVGLYYGDQGEKLNTTTDGVKITGNLHFPDNKKLLLGDDNDLQLVHDGTNSFVGDIGTGYLGLVSSGVGVFIQKHPVGVAETLAKFLNDGAVELYYNNDKKFETISTGCSITGELRVSDDITAFYTSDSNLKTNIKPIDDPLEKVLSLHGYTFDWNEESGKQGSETGVIAQEVEALGLPGLVTTRSNGYLAVNYEKLVPVLLGSIRDLKFMLDKQNEKIKVLTTRINDAETGIESIDERLSK